MQLYKHANPFVLGPGRPRNHHTMTATNARSIQARGPNEASRPDAKGAFATASHTTINERLRSTDIVISAKHKKTWSNWDAIVPSSPEARCSAETMRIPEDPSRRSTRVLPGSAVARRPSAPVIYSLAADLTHGAQALEDESLHCLTWSLAYKYSHVCFDNSPCNMIHQISS